LNLDRYNAQVKGSFLAFDADFRAYAVQEAGKKMDIDLKLDCFEGPKYEREEWVMSQNLMFRERQLFQSVCKIPSMVVATSSFDVA
jgi:hypothetical protein